jgi:hypothetical protein
MELYRIRILKNGKEVHTQDYKQASDYAAIRHARSLADESDQVEVWRGNRCLFTGSPGERGA